MYICVTCPQRKNDLQIIYYLFKYVFELECFVIAIVQTHSQLQPKLSAVESFFSSHPAKKQKICIELMITQAVQIHISYGSIKQH